MDKELMRQVFHLSLGFVAIAVLLMLGRNWLMAAGFFILLAGLLAMNQVLLERRVRVIDLFVELFEREDAPLPGWGSAAYACGVLILVTALEGVPEIAAGILILAAGDSFSTIIGRDGTHRLPYNGKKTAEGSLAFFIASLPAYYFIGPAIVPVAFAAAFVESLDLPVDDNLTVPLTCVLVFLLLGA